MSPESMAFLDANRYHYNWLVNAQMVKHLDYATRKGLLDVIRKEFEPGYPEDLDCSNCVANMLRYVYVQYDKYLAANPA